MHRVVHLSTYILRKLRLYSLRRNQSSDLGIIQVDRTGWLCQIWGIMDDSQNFDDQTPPVEEQLALLGGEERPWFREDHPKFQGIASARGYVGAEYTKPGCGRLKRVHYSHDAMIDYIIANPTARQNELAMEFGFSVPWVSRVIGSDAFQARLAQRKEEISDPFLIATVEERLRGLAMQSIDVISQKLEATNNADIALKALDISTKAVGFGARGGGPQIQNNFVVQLPSKASNAQDWENQYSPARVSSTIDRDPTIPLNSANLGETE